MMSEFIIIQQKEGRVTATRKFGETFINDNEQMEKEADNYGWISLHMDNHTQSVEEENGQKGEVVQRLPDEELVDAFSNAAYNQDNDYTSVIYKEFGIDEITEETAKGEAQKYAKSVIFDTFSWEDLGNDEFSLEYPKGNRLAKYDAEGKLVGDDTKIADIAKIVRQVIFSKLGYYMEDEEGYRHGNSTDANNYAIGLQKDSSVTNGITAHFTKRTSEADKKTVENTLEQMDKNINDMKAETLKINAPAYVAEAINRVKTYKQLEQDANGFSIGGIEDDNLYNKYVSQIQLIWGNIKNKKHLHLIIDRAGLKDIYGGAPNNGTTPESFWNATEKTSSLGLLAPIVAKEADRDTNQLSIKLNLDACGGDLLSTLSHEIAHLIGFNPTDVEADGHFGDIEQYKENEEIQDRQGSNLQLAKLFFDAYFFETILSRK